jgi:isopenicillin-N epimerase
MSNDFEKRYSMAVNAEIEPIQTEPWMLNPDITYLNHGSFGARVASVFDYQIALKKELEASPVDFLDRNRGRLEEARNVVATFLGAEVAGFGFVDNATTGVGCVVNSMKFSQDDEILTTSLVYNGVRQLLSRISKDAGCAYREVPLVLPVHNDDAIVQLVSDALTPKTKLLVIDHVASAAAVVLPVQRIVQICMDKGVLVLVDGAHAPGMLDLTIESVGCDWYVGNLHKWVCAPLGAGFVWAKEEHRASTHPMTVSHRYEQGFTKEFDWQGTKDSTAWLAAAKAVEWGCEVGWERIRNHNHTLVTWMHMQLADAWGVEPLSPLGGSMLGNMATVRLPDWCPQEMDSCFAFRDHIYKKYNIEVPFFELQGSGYVRVSAQLYSRKNHLERLITAIGDFSL